MDIDPLDELPTVMTIAGISKPYIYVLMAQDKFPHQVKIGKSSRWVRSEVLAWVAARITERDSGRAKSAKVGAKP